MRQTLVEKLKRYRPLHAADENTQSEFLKFIHANPKCFERDHWAGHVTGSAWILSPDEHSTLLTHHKKLGIWLQLGGHSDGDPDTLAVALREAQEESGILEIESLSDEIFDIDIHPIPARKTDPPHFHFDVRFLFKAKTLDFKVSEESNALSWVPLEKITRYSTEASLLRMLTKSLQRNF